MNIDLKPETVDDIARQTLIQIRDGFKEDLKKDGPRIFHSDPVKDKKEIRRYLRALVLIIKHLT